MLLLTHSLTHPASLRYELTALSAILDAIPDDTLQPNVYSWHEYIYEYPTLTEELFNTTEAGLRDRGAPLGTEQIVTEWNTCPPGADCGSGGGDAWAAADFAQTVLVQATLGVTVSAPYPLCSVNADWGLLSTTLDPDRETLVWRPQAYAFQMMSDVLRETPHVWTAGLAVERLPDSPDDTYRAAGFASPDKRTVNLVYVARTKDSPLEEVLVRVACLPPNTTYTVTAWVLDDGRNYAPVGASESAVVDGDGGLQLQHSYPGASPGVLRVRLVAG